MNFGALIIGDEILSGRREDKHLARTIAALESRGLALSWARYIGDEPVRIVAEIRAAAASGDTVFSFGGIGATPDDHTRQCAARALGVELVLHPEAAALITQRGTEMAAEKGIAYDTTGPDHQRRLNMGVFPAGAAIIPNPYNKIAGFTIGHVHFVPGFPVMAWPMMEWVLDTHYRDLHGQGAQREKSVIVYGAMEATLTPLMERVEAEFAGVKVFSLPSVDHPEYGRHIELGVKGDAQLLDAAYEVLLGGLRSHGAKLGPELTR